MSITKRCNAQERKAFSSKWGMEPALGPLEERLNIIIRRHGGRIGSLSKLSDDERAELMNPDNPLYRRDEWAA